jgi:RNA-binding protein PNO1
MVVTPKLFSSTTSSSGVKAKKNRRRITRKNPTQTHPSSSHHLDNEDEDTDMTLAAASSSLEVEAEPPISTAAAAAAADSDDELMIDKDPILDPSTSSAPVFPPVTPGAEKTTLKSETRRIPMPPHRMTPLKKDWLNIFGPLTEILGLQVRMNVQRRSVEVRVCVLDLFFFFLFQNCEDLTKLISLFFIDLETN